MLPARPVRVPLQVGLASLRNMVRASLFWWFGLMFLVSPLFVSPMASSLLDGLPRLIAGPLTLVALAMCALLGVCGLAFGSGAREDAAREAPSDLFLDRDHVRIEDGSAKGRAIAWTQLDPASCQVVDEQRQERIGLRHTVLSVATLGQWKRAQRFRPLVRRLRVATRDGKEILLARSDDEAEVASFRALAETLRAMCGDAAESRSPEPPPDAPKLLACGSCASPLAPADAPEVRCHHCGQTAMVSDDLRARIRAPEELPRGRSAARLVRRLQRQQAAATASLWLGAARWLLRLSWPGAMAAFVLLVWLQERVAEPHFPAVRVLTGHGSPVARAALLGAATLALAFNWQSIETLDRAGIVCRRDRPPSVTVSMYRRSS